MLIHSGEKPRETVWMLDTGVIFQFAPRRGRPVLCISRIAKGHATGHQGSGLDRGKTVTEPFTLIVLGNASSEKQIPQVVENLESGDKSKEALETGTLRVKQAL